MLATLHAPRRVLTHALAGRNVVVVTPTASGKTLCFTTPRSSTPCSRSLEPCVDLFPTKALTQDQLAELHAMCEVLPLEAGDKVGVFAYDGDTPQDARRDVRTRAHLVLSNPDMASLGDPAASSALGQALRESALHRH